MAQAHSSEDRRMKIAVAMAILDGLAPVLIIGDVDRAALHTTARQYEQIVRLRACPMAGDKRARIVRGASTGVSVIYDR